jgi:subtilisin-like proprotein convertase family protein
VTDAGVGTPNRLLHVDPTTPANDFTLTATPANVTVTAGGTVTTTIAGSVTRGASQPVALAARGVPAGVTATFQSASISSNGGTTLTFGAASTALAGTYTVTVIGTGTAATRAVAVQLRVDDPAACVRSDGTDRAITDFQNLYAPITVTGCAGNAARNSTVEVHIEHAVIGELDVRLISPRGTWYFLMDHTGGDSDRIDYTFTYDLSAEPANGTWNLYVSDNLAQGTGFLDSWKINLAGANLPAPACGGVATADVRIPASGTVESPISVADCGRAPSTTSYVEVSIAHQYGRDLQISLVAPGGQVVLLKESLVGSYKANAREAYIADLSGKPTRGTWKLRVENVAGYEGLIEGWKLTL